MVQKTVRNGRRPRLVLQARPIRTPDLLPLVPALMIAIANARIGESIHDNGESNHRMEKRIAM